MRYRLVSTSLLCLALSCAFSRQAQAQTSAALLLKPWPEDQAVEADANAYFLESASTNRGGSLQLNEYEAEGRVRFVPGNVVSPRLGFDFKFFDQGGRNTVIPRNLSDESIAIGTAVGKYQDWVAGLTLGVGYAGDSAFSRGSGWYGRATFAAGRKINDTDGLGLVVDYDGNRPYLQDIPLPGFVYQRRIDPTILLSAGVPYSSIEWKPIDRLTITGSYELLDQFSARVGYEVIKHVEVYGSFDNDQEAFHTAGLRKDRRLLFAQKRAELGLKYNPNDHLSILLAGGYSFDNRFYAGFDLQKTQTVLHIQDTPYLHAALELRF